MKKLFAICILFYLTAYAYGKIYKHYVPELSGTNNTIFGFLSIYAIFEIAVLFVIPLQISSRFLFVFLGLIFLFPFLFCLVRRISLLPDRQDFISLVICLSLIVLFSYTSSLWNINTIDNDSADFLAVVGEASVNDKLGLVSHYSGDPLSSINALDDYMGSYYLWGMILRAMRMTSSGYVNLIPCFIWGASVLTWMMLGQFISFSFDLISPFTKKTLPVNLLALLVISPFLTRPIISYLAFYGNAARTIAIGGEIVILYLYNKSHRDDLFLLQLVPVLSAVSFSASSMSVLATVAVVMFVALVKEKHMDGRTYFLLLAGIFPLFYLFGATIGYKFNRPQIPISLAIMVMGALIMVYMRTVFKKHEKLTFTVIKWFLILYLVFCVVYAFFHLHLILYFFNPLWYKEALSPSLFTWSSWSEALRNIVFWLMMIHFVRHDADHGVRSFLLIDLVLFMNPIVNPAAADFMFDKTFNRIFDVIVNPFSLILIATASITWLLANRKTILVPFLAAGIETCAALPGMLTPISELNTPDESFDRWSRISSKEYDMMNYICQNIEADDEHRPLFLSQSMSLRAYVPNTRMVFSSIILRYRGYEASFLSQGSLQAHLMIDFNPLFKYRDHKLVTFDPDPSRYDDDIIKSGADYVIMGRPQLILYDGKYIEAYTLISPDVAVEIYRNDDWVLLKVCK